MRGGKRPGAGRKAHLEDKTVEEIVNLAAKTVYEALQPDSELPYEMRVELASRVLVKAMPQNVSIDSTQRKIHELAVTVSGLTTDELRGLIEASRVRALPQGTVGAGQIGQTVDTNEER